MYYNISKIFIRRTDTRRSIPLGNFFSGNNMLESNLIPKSSRWVLVLAEETEKLYQIKLNKENAFLSTRPESELYFRVLHFRSN